LPFTLRGRGGSESDHQQPTTPGRRAQRRFRVRAAHRIIDDVRTPASGEVEDALAQIRLLIVDRLLRAELPVKGELLLAGDSGNDLRPHRLSHLDGGGTDASGSA
jgi:hypothetical protein